MLNPPARIKPPIRAALFWFALMFALGFLLGTLRVLVTAPRFGELAGVLIELPVMIGAGWLSARWLIRRCGVGPQWRARAIMAGLFLCLLAGAEMLLGLHGFGRSLAQQLAALGSAAGLAGLAGQLITASIPLWPGRHSS